MRPQRYMQFAADAYRAADLHAEPWTESSRPFGIKVRLASGAEVWHAITAQSREGEQFDEPEQPVEGEPPAPVEVPSLGTGRTRVTDIERYLTALVINTGSPEIAQGYAYSEGSKTGNTPGYGVRFHSGARVFAPFVHVLRPGQTPGKEFDVPQEV